jgi:hypothetical protein
MITTSRRSLFSLLAAFGFASGVSITKTGFSIADATPGELMVTGTMGVSESTQGKSVLGYVLDYASTNEKERGYREWCTAISDDKIVRVYLDGVYQQHCEAADCKDGWVRRCVVSPESGDIVADWTTGNILKETVYGFVTIEVTDRQAA